MFEVTVKAATAEELSLALRKLAAQFAGTTAIATGTVSTAPPALNAGEQAQLRQDAIVVAPTGKAKKDKTKKDAEPETPAEEPAPPAEETPADATETPAENNAASSSESSSEAPTLEDAKAALMDYRTATGDASVIKKTVNEIGKAESLTKVDPANYAAIIAHCRANSKKK